MRNGILVAGATALLAAAPALAHHSYAMFDLARPTVVEGSVARLEWRNPHTFLWIYVQKPDRPGEYDLYSFENGPVGLLTRLGWNKDMFRVGEPVAVQYFPLRDGRTGGHLVRVVRSDGSEVAGDKFAPGASALLEQGPLDIRPGAATQESAR